MINALEAVERSFAHADVVPHGARLWHAADVQLHSSIAVKSAWHIRGVAPAHESNQPCLAIAESLERLQDFRAS